MEYKIKKIFSVRKHHQQTGFTLIELLVAVTLSLFLLAGVATLYINTFTVQRDAAMTENLRSNARAAMSIASSGLPSAGYFSGLNVASVNSKLSVSENDCAGLASAERASPVFMAGRVTEANLLSCATGQVGVYSAENAGPSDWFLFRGALGPRLEATSLDANSNYLAANTQEGVLFKGNSPPLMSTDREIRAYHFNLFYLRDNKLMLTRLVGDELQELTLADGVEALRVFLGVDKNGNGEINSYTGVTEANKDWSAAQWHGVKSIRLHILTRSDTSPDYNDERSYLLGDINVQPNGDQRKRSLTTNTVFLYNQKYW